MPTLSKPKQPVFTCLQKVKAMYHPDLCEAEVTVGLLMAFPNDLDEYEVV